MINEHQGGLGACRRLAHCTTTAPGYLPRGYAGQDLARFEVAMSHSGVMPGQPRSAVEDHD